ncbi:outer membrane protein assembly factor BamB family protein [Pedobacter namyangjuensis]|uniref:outer membrane protein assembly factor BamB family protein n=1 Tax=Pedobacter namyangjuensis TaxID=600626 RepID=UPI000DE4EB51|nr:PQQ-binding-like beta-propeller repeat protein [Pedobacter namyangjuensis]
MILKTNLKKSIAKLMLAGVTSTLLFSSCSNQSAEEKTIADHETLIVSTHGKVMNINLEQNKIQWQFQSKYNSEGNRNLFSLSDSLLVQPFESGELIAFNLNTGKILWQEHILGGGGGNEDAVATADGQLDTAFVNSKKPLFMTQPLIAGNSVYISSTNQPQSSDVPALYNFNKKTGEKMWVENLPTVFNLFKPVLHNDFVFVNSAVYLNMYSKNEGTNTSYGVFDGADELPNAEKSQFVNPIYVQMQSDGKKLYVGDENGKFYALHFDSKNSLPVSDITDPNNTFAKNPKLFDWVFEDASISSIQEDGNTYIYDNYILACVNQKDKTQPAIIAIDKSNGKLKWKTELKGIEEWRLVGDKITATDGELIYLLNTDGKIVSTIKTEKQFAPISNIEIDKNEDLIYATEQGIVKYDVKTKKFAMLLKQTFKKEYHDYFQVKYLNKK